MDHEDDETLWERGWEGHAAAQRRRMARLPLWVKIQWLEEAQQIVEHLARSRAANRVGDAPASAVCEAGASREPGASRTSAMESPEASE